AGRPPPKPLDTQRLRGGGRGQAAGAARGATVDASAAGSGEGEVAVVGVAASGVAMPGSEVTGVIGTSWYIAPEIVDGWAYDEKVDLFSLGVVVFELWHPFSTAMERALRLRDLRENGQLPDSFQANHPTITHLIRWLMSSNPHDRPSAREVLASGLLPPRVQDEQVGDVLRSLPDAPDTAARLLDGLFRLGARQAAEQRSMSAAAQGLPAPDVAPSLLEQRQLGAKRGQPAGSVAAPDPHAT
ncbi:hypothetical protein QJQ45_014190, partial [Haematococcus lacustris]